MRNRLERHGTHSRSRGGTAAFCGPLALLLPVLLASAAVLVAGCSGQDVFTGSTRANIPPTIELTGGPIEGDTTKYTVHFFWFGEDDDGYIDHYEFCMAEGDPVGFDPADTAGAWLRTELTDSIFLV